ncbi:hypothetical protein ASC93_17450 [Massilia sp. Root335]|nr:hypothetical protein ASC93_17450 [Massilia sp. Root335]
MLAIDGKNAGLNPSKRVQYSRFLLKTKAHTFVSAGSAHGRHDIMIHPKNRDILVIEHIAVVRMEKSSPD